MNLALLRLEKLVYNSQRAFDKVEERMGVVTKGARAIIEWATPVRNIF